MAINTCCILLVLVFFGLVTYSVYREEQREAERRLQSLSVLVDRRTQDRRTGGLRAFLPWAIRALRALWQKPTP